MNLPYKRLARTFSRIPARQIRPRISQPQRKLEKHRETRPSIDRIPPSQDLRVIEIREHYVCSNIQRGILPGCIYRGGVICIVNYKQCIRAAFKRGSSPRLWRRRPRSLLRRPKHPKYCPVFSLGFNNWGNFVHGAWNRPKQYKEKLKGVA